MGTKWYATGITDEHKVALALERKKEIRTIRKGDYMTLKNSPQKAISYYQTALEQLPNDIVIRRKLAHAYFLVKDWKNSYDNYARVPIAELKEEEQTELFQALFSDDTRPDRLIELSKYTINKDIKDYYQIVDNCNSGIHNCIVTIVAYTGTATKIVNIQDIIKKSSKISPDYSYRDFLVSAEFYRQSMYRVADILTDEILSKRPNYIEVRKLRGFTLYELGKYSQARDILLQYLEHNPKDIESIVRLGEIFTALGDYTTSILYLNNAILAGYQHKIEIERRLAYNYAELWDHTAMLKVLSYLIQEQDVTEDDYAVAISLALREWENTRAYAWSYAAIEKYKDSTVLIPLYLSALRINGKAQEIKSFIHTLSDEIAQNPIIQLEYAISLYEDGSIDEALSVFTNIRDIDTTSDWWIEATNYIRVIEALKIHSGSLQFQK